MADSRFLSIPYLLLRSSTAGGALLTGLVQTFVFARILSPDRFSVFILVGTLGVTLWLCDLGMAKIVFVRMRERFIAGVIGRDTAEQASAVTALYVTLSLLCTLVCFGVAALAGSSLWNAAELALFFLFTSLNLAWFAIRNVSVAVDEFVGFETLEAARRLGHIAITLVMLAGLPLMAFLLIANAMWGGLFVLACRRLLRRGAITGEIRALPAQLRNFLRDNRREVLRTGTYAANEFYLYNFPYLVVPAMFGLGAPTIILDTAFKIFRGATVVYSAGCDLAVPRQTRAFAERDRRSLTLATLMAAALCALPAAVMCALLILASEKLFAILLGPAATMPPQAVWLLIVLLIANLAQTVSNFLLVHTGFFREIARLATFVTIAMTLATGAALLTGMSFIGFLQVYTAIYVASAAAYLALAISGPIRCAGARPAAS
jgi:O-antigen/teichoic acid export membrane protein